MISLSLVAGCLWVVLSTIVALLPMRAQYPPGLALLIAAPCLLGWIAWDHGWWIFAVGLFAFASMFRNPLIYLTRRAIGKTRDEVPS